MNSRNKTSIIGDIALEKTVSSIDNARDEITENEIEDFQGNLKGLLKKSRNKKESALSPIHKQNNSSPRHPTVSSDRQSRNISPPDNTNSFGSKSSILNKTLLKTVGKKFLYVNFIVL